MTTTDMLLYHEKILLTDVKILLYLVFLGLFPIGLSSDGVFRKVQAGDG